MSSYRDRAAGPQGGRDLEAVLEDMEKRMRAADQEFEEAARLRDEIKRLRETEPAAAADPLARQTAIETQVEKPRSSGRRPGTQTYKRKGRRH